MKTVVTIIALIGVIATSSITFGAAQSKVDLICTGEEWYPNIKVRSPYSFRLQVDLDSKKFTLQLVQNADNNKANYPRDTGIPAARCSTTWNVDITDTELRIIGNCTGGSGFTWEIRRTDGLFTLIDRISSPPEERAKGKCVKSSERAF